MPIFKREQDPPFNQIPIVGRQNSVPAVRSEPLATPAPPAIDPAPPTAIDPPAREAPRPASQLDRASAAVLDKKTEITGNVRSEGNVLIEGAFHGELEARETIWVEQGARTQGQLRATDVVISGTFDGEIGCQNRLQIAASATVSGEIRTPVLVIEEGATINCRFNMRASGR